MDSSLTSNSQRRLKERNSISNTFLLHTLDDELKFSETNDRLKQEMLLDLVRASVRFRTRTLLKVWHAVCKEFPRDNGSHYKNGSIPFVVKLSDHANGEKGTLMSKLFGTEPVQVKAPFQSFNTFEDEFQQSNDSEFDQTETTDGENRAFRDRLEDTIPFYDDALKNIVSENILIEESAYSAYLEQKIFSIRSSIISGYSLFVLKDMSGTMPTRDSFHSDSFGVPTHLSRILLMIGQERVILRKELGRLGVELGFIRRPENKIANVNKDDPTTESGGNTSRKNSFSGTSFIYTHHHRKDTSNTASLGTNFDNFSFNNNASSHINASEAAYDENDPDDYDSIIADSVMTQMQAIQHQLYSDFLFREICNSFMDVYGELIGKIVCNSLMEMTGSSATVPSRGIRKSGAIDSFSMRSPIKDAVGGSHGLFVPTAVGVGSIPYSDTVTPVALGQAIEEYEFLKVWFTFLTL